MNDLIRSFLVCLDGIGYFVALPLLALSVALWILLAERSVALGSAPWELLIPSRRRARHSAHATFMDALGDYLSEPVPARAERLVVLANGAHGPGPLFVRRSLGSAARVPPALRKLCLQGAYRLGQIEIWTGSDLLQHLARALLLAGLLAVITGLRRVFFDLSASGVHQESVWLDSAPGVLLACGLATFCFLPAFLGQLWISTETSRRARELDLRYAALLGSMDSLREARSW